MYVCVRVCVCVFVSESVDMEGVRWKWDSDDFIVASLMIEWFFASAAACVFCYILKSIDCSGWCGQCFFLAGHHRSSEALHAEQGGGNRSKTREKIDGRKRKEWEEGLRKKTETGWLDVLLKSTEREIYSSSWRHKQTVKCRQKDKGISWYM